MEKTEFENLVLQSLKVPWWFFYATETYFTHFLEEARFPNASPFAKAKGEALGNRASSIKCVKYVSVA